MTETSNIQFTKRDFLTKLGMIGGSAAVMAALGGLDHSLASDMKAPPMLHTSGNGKKVIILGAGMAGLVSALELSKKGYDCTILEARDFAGGRNSCQRKGTKTTFKDGSTHTCDFDHGQYLNQGAWRIPGQHHSTLHYARSLNVPLEVMLNHSTQSYLYSETIDGPLKGKRVRRIHMESDRKGYVAELLAKCAKGGALDDMLSAEDIEKLLTYLKGMGLINNETFEYQANIIRGYSSYKGGGDNFGTLSDPYPLSDLLNLNMAARELTSDHPTCMFQAVGGMDQIAFAIRDALPNGVLHLNKEVTKISQNGDAVNIEYKDTNSGEAMSISGDFCISTIPFAVVTGIDNDFSADIIEAMNAPTPSHVAKFGVQMKNRFWETEDMIYGGVSTSSMAGTLAYPSADLHGTNGGVLLAGYLFGPRADSFSDMTMAERTEFMLSVGEKLHPGQFRENFNGKAAGVIWQDEKYNKSGWSSWRGDSVNKLPALLKGQNRMLFSGDCISPRLSGWLAGAIEGAWVTIAELDKRAAQI
ncbi:flavin monoamine oxidase family protein [Pseudemcibacter aquimaris]|uniref:flavin monoamine oxidase family protein n=1 Tax=Pseudemcibacter aquimaris TaxID=2857064 RepID=UPI002012A0B2|nr:FAD-dependent oxidoreductase [Pseudemcibacter aquimaris]MCC3859903.1 FAD-dependent oxidoreductase [Pseudemcibacter aquimaris]WDU57235.1 FAD-dependent oxidoreductase [Pseudemcibacter aquimaris]